MGTLGVFHLYPSLREKLYNQHQRERALAQTPINFLTIITLMEAQTDPPPAQGLTSIAHGAEDALGDTHDGVSGLVVAADGLSSTGKLPHVLQEVMQGLADHTGRRADLLQELAVISGCLAGADAVLHRAVYELPCFNQLLLAHRGADGGAHHLQRDGSGSGTLLVNS